MVAAAAAAPTANFLVPAMTPILCAAASDSVSIEFSRSEKVISCPTNIQPTVESLTTKFVPSIRSGSHTDIGPRKSNEDKHIQIDDLSAQLGSLYRWPLPSAFFAIFDGHGGSEAASYVKDNAMRFFFEDADLLQASHIDDAFLDKLGNSHRRAFMLADHALADECIDSYCGTTALTAMVIGRHLLIANAGDTRAVLCRKGIPVQISQDHRPSYLPEQKRVEDLGGTIEDGYLNGELAVTRALGDWFMKLPVGSASPLTAEPDVQHIELIEDDEFLIIGCDGIWDVMSNLEAVSLVSRELRLHSDPQKCAIELVNHALLLDSYDNLTAIVVCFATSELRETVPQRPRLRRCNLSAEARSRLKRLLEGN